MTSLTRRRFLEVGGGLTALPFFADGLVSSVAKAAGEVTDMPERVVRTSSTFDCGGKCAIKAHIKNGILTRISTRRDDELVDDMPIMRACVRGRGYRRFVYNPDRLKYPMKRVGKRGEGRFERISWDEATDIIAREWKRIGDKYGPASRFCTVNTAETGGAYSGDTMAKRLLCLTGGYLGYYHSVSQGNSLAATPYTYGVATTGNSHDTLLDSKLVILWGHNPVETIFGHTNHYFQEMKRRGIKFIVVDPRYSDTVSAYADQWVPLLPTTDNALMDAMAYVIVSENLHDKTFLDTYCLGFDDDHMPDGIPAEESVVAYLMGRKDGTPKTPEWAEQICKVPANTIRQLARDYASAKPAALIQGWGPQRHGCGERTVRGATLLACLTGNVGKRGGWASGHGGCAIRKFPVVPDVVANPVKASISIMNWMQAVEDAGKITPAMGLLGAPKLDANIKMIFCLAGNYLTNQNPDVNATAKLLADESKVEFIVCTDLYLTPSAKYSDILLPATSFLEQWNLASTWGTASYLTLSEQLIEPVHESRNAYDWLTDVARKLGVEKEFTLGRTQKQWVEAIVAETRKKMPDEGIPTFDEFMTRRVHHFKNATNYIAFQKQIEDPANNKFPTPSGKIELFSKRLYDMKNPEIPAIPRYVSCWEGPEDPLTKTFPLQLITWKGRNRANSTFQLNPWEQAVQPQQLWINPIDADRRGLKKGDLVRVFNGRGEMEIGIDITPRIIPGVVALQSAAWWKPGKDGVDRGGCANVLTSTRMTALAHGNAHQTLLVEVRKV
jgi:anaerobic dimethyl sulfoxide reductase subunit A